MTPALTGKERRFLRALAHDMDPVVQLGKLGLTEGVVGATDVALDTHELIKLRVGTECPEPVQDIAEALAPQVRAELVQVLGRTILLFRINPKNPRVPLPGRAMAKAPRSQAKSKPKRRPSRARPGDGGATAERGAAPARGAAGRASAAERRPPRRATASRKNAR